MALFTAKRTGEVIDHVITNKAMETVKIVVTVAISLWLLIKLFDSKSEYNKKDNNVNY